MPTQGEHGRCQHGEVRTRSLGAENNVRWSSPLPSPSHRGRRAPQWGDGPTRGTCPGRRAAWARHLPSRLSGRAWPAPHSVLAALQVAVESHTQPPEEGLGYAAPAHGCPVPEKGQLSQCHLQTRLLGPGVAAENVKHHRESVEHRHAPAAFQFLLQREAREGRRPWRHLG